MPKTKLFTLAIIALLIPVFCILNQPGCTNPSNVQQVSAKTEPLRVRRSGGKVETITFAQAMDYHHDHEDHTGAVTSATPAKDDKNKSAEDHDDGLCIGVTTGYQAIRYSVEQLFPNEIPLDSDIDISVAGSMRGVRDVLTLYSGKTPASPNKLQKFSIRSFTFTAKRISTGDSLRFSLKPELIPLRFFQLKNEGASCGHPELDALKKQTALKILYLQPQDCFDHLHTNGQRKQHIGQLTQYAIRPEDCKT